MCSQAGLEYSSLSSCLEDGSLASQLEASGAVVEDVREIVRLVKEHFQGEGAGQEAVSSN